jgi:hypothetical protein
MSADIVEDLLKDAHLVADFGARAGRLSDSGLFEAIRKVEASRGTGWNGQDIAALQTAMNDAIVMIRPVSLVDLHSGWNPFEKPKKLPLLDQWSRYFFIAFAAVMIFFCAYYLFWVRDIEATRIELAKNKTDVQYELLVELYEDFRRLLPISQQLLAMPEGDLDTAVDLARVTLRQKINKIINITNEIEADKDEIARLRLSRYPWNTYYKFVRATSQSAPPYKGPYKCMDYLKLPERPKEEIKRDFPDWTNLTEFRLRDPYDIQLTKCIAGVEEIEQFRSAHRPLGETYDPPGKITKGWVRLMDGWILPALFGALGAVIYHLRICADRLRPDPSLGRALMRIFLGAFAGISFGWFVSPATTNEILGWSLPIGAYTIAFLIGYSIDVFYALLDKAVVLISGWVEGLGTQPASGR